MRVIFICMLLGLLTALGGAIADDLNRYDDEIIRSVYGMMVFFGLTVAIVSLIAMLIEWLSKRPN